jgi:bifunctional non-homologous end joining protein LigD
VLSWRPQPLIRVGEAFDARDWIFELKHDGFRAFAVVSGHHCTLVSRRGHVFQQWPQLAEELAHTVKAEHAVLDGEIVCLKADGGSDFHRLLFRRDWPYFFAFDLLTLDGNDLRCLPLLARKRALRRLMPRYESRLRYVDHVAERGRDFFDLACAHDAEGVVGKWASGVYHVDGTTTSWLKVKNAAYTQAIGRHELFEARGGWGAGRSTRKSYRLDPAATAARRQRVTPRASA